MIQRPSFKSFVKGSFPKNNKYLAFNDEDTGKIYREKNAFSTRIIFEVILIVFPMSTYIAMLLLDIEKLTILLFMGIYIITYLIINFAYFFRYIFVRFEEIDNVEEANTGRFRLIEIPLILTSIIFTLGLVLSFIMKFYS